MSVKERLLEIDDLIIAETLPHLTAQQLDEYIEVLNNFIEDFPRLESEIKRTSENKDIESMHEKILDLSKRLTEIGADDIAAECTKYTSNISGDKQARFEAYVHFLLTQLAALSIDIQMALFKEDEPEPEATAGEDAVAEMQQPDEATLEMLAGTYILAVDDDPQCLDVFKLAMKDVPCKIIAVTSGAAALDILNSLVPSLFVFDIDMPDMNGLELAEKVRERGSKAPIVFITGNVDKNIVMKALKAGGTDFIYKPINPANVVGRIVKSLAPSNSYLAKTYKKQK